MLVLFGTNLVFRAKPYPRRRSGCGPPSTAGVLLATNSLRAICVYSAECGGAQAQHFRSARDRALIRSAAYCNLRTIKCSAFDALTE